MAKIILKLDVGGVQAEARRYMRENGEVLLADFLRIYPARAREALSEEYLGLPLARFLLSPLKLRQGMGVWVSPVEVGGKGNGKGNDSHPLAPSPVGGALRQAWDGLYEQEVRLVREAPTAYPEQISDNEAVKVAYGEQLQKIAGFLRHDLSVLVRCDKILTEYIYEFVCQRAGREPLLDSTLPAGKEPTRTGGVLNQNQGRQEKGDLEANLPLLIRHLKSDQVLVLRSVDMLDSPSLIEVLYQSVRSGRKPQLLAFLDSSLEVKKVLTDRFAVHISLMGLPRYIQPDPQQPRVHSVTRLIKRQEYECFKDFDPEGLYKNVSGLNVIQFRNAMRYVGATVAPASEARAIYQRIRDFKTSSSSEIEIPDTTFEDIGGYEEVKQELRRIIELVAGRVKGIEERERQRLIPRGFVFHGPPGTGKTLFAKAIANEMNATIQMVSGPEIMDKYVGQSENNLRQIFATARRNAPSVIFFDEFDSIAAQRSNYSDGGARANNAVVAQMLTELDGFREGQAVLVIGTSNRIDIIDEALLRPSRLKPIKIDLPDEIARRRVAEIHALNFGIDTLLADLCQLVLKYLPQWQADQRAEIPFALWRELFAQHPPYQIQYEKESHRATLNRGLQEVFDFVQKAQQLAPTVQVNERPVLEQIKQKLTDLGKQYGTPLEGISQEPASREASGQAVLEVKLELKAALRDLFVLLEDEQGQAVAHFSPQTFLDHLFDLIAEFSQGFNNDEIRSIFQEASLEHHLEGQLITPRYLGMKIGLLRKRRDERDIVHLSSGRGR